MIFSARTQHTLLDNARRIADNNLPRWNVGHNDSRSAYYSALADLDVRADESIRAHPRLGTDMDGKTQ